MLKNLLRYFTIIFCLFVFGSMSSSAQKIAAYIDYNRKFYVFDDGALLKAEYLPVKSFKEGGNAVAYVDNTNQFKIFYNKEAIDLKLFADYFEYNVSRSLVGYKFQNVVWIFDRGRVEKLTNYCSQFFLGDSLAVYYDDSQSTLGVYYNNKVYEAASSLLQAPRSIKCGGNLAAFVDQSGYFRIFYHGTTFETDNVAPDNYIAGTDICAYTDGYNHNFNIFYLGQKAVAETFPPKSYQCGNGIVAYVDDNNEFKIFYNNATRKLSSFAPEFYEVNGNTIIYFLQNRFYAWYNGTVTELENYKPRDYQLDFDGLAYIDQRNWLTFFDRGTKKVVSYEPAADYNLNGQVLKFTLGTNDTKFYLNGTTY